MAKQESYLRDGRAPIPLKEATSKAMSANRGKDTRPELTLRKAIWDAGIRGYRLHWKAVPGRPDMVFTRYKVALFIHGCFWHSCIDFFCGGGGFSEGFRQAGFDVIWAVDNWKVAVDTHNENHTEGTTICDDVIRISQLPDNEFHELVPDSNVIIGSPPCTFFSNSNRSGNGNKSGECCCIGESFVF